MSGLPKNSLAVLASFAAASAGAREVLTPEEEATRSLEERREARPVLRCEPNEISAKLKRGNTALRRITVRNAGGKTLSWSVVSAPGWVRLERLSGELGFEEERALVVVVDAGGLGAGRHEGKIVISAPDAGGSPAEVGVACEVEPGPVPVGGPAPVLACGPKALEATVTQGASVRLPFAIRNDGGRTLGWWIAEAPEWIDFDLRSGELPSSSQRTVYATVNARRLATGKRSARIVVEAAGAEGSPDTIELGLDVKYAPSGSRATRFLYWSGQSTVWTESGGPDGTDFDIDRGFAVEFAFGRRFGLDLGLGSLDGEETGFGPLGGYRIERFVAGAGLRYSFPQGSRVQVHLSAGYAHVTFDIPEGNLFVDGEGPYGGVALSFAPSRRVSLQLQYRHLGWSGHDSQAFPPISLDEDIDAFGFGLALHY
jgi:hypothetical protein